MEENKILTYIKEVLKNLPTDWLNLTTHRLDIYDEKAAKTQFLEQFEILCKTHNSDPSALTVATHRLRLHSFGASFVLCTRMDPCQSEPTQSRKCHQFFITDCACFGHFKNQFIKR